MYIISRHSESKLNDAAAEIELAEMPVMQNLLYILSADGEDAILNILNARQMHLLIRFAAVGLAYMEDKHPNPDVRCQLDE